MRRRIVSSQPRRRNIRAGKPSNLNEINFRLWSGHESGRRGTIRLFGLFQALRAGMAGGPGFLLPLRTPTKAGLAAGMIGAKRFHEPALSLCDEDRLSILAAEGEVRRFLCVELDFPFQYPSRAQHGDGAFENPRHQKISLGVGAQAVDVKIVEPLEKFGREQVGSGKQSLRISLDFSGTRNLPPEYLA